MIQIRHDVFETNSSSTHSLTMCTAEVFKQWEDGNALFDDWNETFVEALKPTEKDFYKAKEIYNKNKTVYNKDWEDLDIKSQTDYVLECVHDVKSSDDSRYLTRSAWIDRHGYDTETFTQHFTTPNGEEIVAFGYYGYDG